MEPSSWRLSRKKCNMQNGYCRDTQGRRTGGGGITRIAASKQPLFARTIWYNPAYREIHETAHHCRVQRSLYRADTEAHGTSHQPQVHTAQVKPVKIILLELLLLQYYYQFRAASPWNPAYTEVHGMTHDVTHHCQVQPSVYRDPWNH